MVKFVKPIKDLAELLTAIAWISFFFLYVILLKISFRKFDLLKQAHQEASKEVPYPRFFL